MGGGDLNLKKSWHPNTMKNQERVWKAEQADAAEKNKLAELQREISDERNREELKRIGQVSGVLNAPDANKKLEWMYKSGDLLNREEYLLGRSIDKNFERVDAEEKEALVGVQVHKNHVEHECIPFSIRSYHGIQMSDEQVDLQRKIMEDPLMAIRQREMETRKKLLENPVKLKEIHRLLRNDTDLDGESRRGKDKNSKKKNKKEKKSKKSKKGSKNDLDELLAKKYRKIRKETLDDQDEGNLDIDKFLALKYNQLSNELDKMGGKTSKSKKKTSKDDNEKNERMCDRQPYEGRGRGNDYRDQGSVGDSKMDRRQRNFDDDNRHQRNYSRSPDHNRNRNRSVSPSRRDGHSNNRQRDERSNRERDRRSASHDRFNRNRRERSNERNERKRRSSSKDRDRRNRRQPSQDRRRSPSRDRIRRSRSRSTNARAKYENSTSRRRSRSRDDRSSNKVHQSTRITSNAAKSIRSSSRRRSRSRSREERSSNKIQQSTRITSEAAKSTRSSSSSSYSSSSSSSSSSNNASDDEDRPKMVYGLVSADGKKIEIKNKYQPVERKERDKVAKKITQAKPKRVALTEEEKERKLMEMQDNARMRVIECQQIMERNKKEKQAEEAQLSQTFDKDYVNKEMRKALANQFSVESRIKSNINNIQRSGRTMEANFAKR